MIRALISRIRAAWLVMEPEGCGTVVHVREGRAVVQRFGASCKDVAQLVGLELMLERELRELRGYMDASVPQRDLARVRGLARVAGRS